MDYRQAGVDIDAGNETVRRIRSLARATFTGETASGWQQVTFSPPVIITANTTYVASYHTTSGGYASTAGYFSASGRDNVPLHALRSGVDGPNGVYRYGATGGFPTESASRCAR